MAAPAAGRRHFPCFDGLRAFAALSVVAIHTSFDSGLTVRSPVGIYTARLEIGVSVFFLISGFLLYRPFAVAHLEGAPPPALGPFWLRRLLRILPAYWVALTVTDYVLHVNSVTGGWLQVLVHYGFGQIYVPSQQFRGLTQAWSLCTEMSYYLLLPLYAAAVAGRARRTARRQLGRELVGLVLLTAVSYGFRDWAFHQHGALVGTMGDWLPAYGDLFALGMVLAVASAWFRRPGGAEPRWLAHPLMPWLAWAGAGVSFWGVSHLGISLMPVYHQAPASSLERQGLYGLFAFFLLLPAVFGDQQRGLIRALLRLRPVAAVGVVSYGVYLWHQAMVTEYLKLTHVRLFLTPFWPMFLAVSAAAVAVASASYWVAEKPALRLKGLLRPRARAGAPVAVRPAAERVPVAAVSGALAPPPAARPR